MAWLKLVEEEDELLLEIVADRVESLCGYKPDLDTVARFLEQNLKTPLRSTAPIIPRIAVPTPAAPATSPAVVVTVRNVNQGVLPGTGFTLLGKFSPSRNARDVLVSVVEALAKRDNTFLERFVSLPRHGRTRRYIALDRNDLYPGRPDLVQEFSHQLRSGYWLGINISRKQVERIVTTACEVAGLNYGADLKINLGQT